MWSYYKKTFLAVQFVAVFVSWMVYSNTKHELVPTAVFFLFMQASAVLGAMWANRLHRKIQRSASCASN
jgi:ABC-type bacteriocin/lantibiotic exporter with double-glycine peptidase domain